MGAVEVTMDKSKTSGAAKALSLWAQGKGEATEDAREGAREVIAECRRLREILRVMAEAGLGEGAMVEILRPRKESAINFVVCCGSRDERVLAEGIFAVMRAVFDAAGVDLVPTEGAVTGTLAMDDGEDGR